MNVTVALKRLIKQAGGKRKFQVTVGIKSHQLLNHYLRTGRVGSPETCAYIRYHYGVDLYPPMPYKPPQAAKPVSRHPA